MRGSGWLLFVPGAAIWIAAALWPMIAAIAAIANESAEPASTTAGSITSLTLSTIKYALLIALGAMILGWLPGRVLARARSGRARLVLVFLLLLPICLPAYVVFYAWWQLWPADSALHAWAVRHEQIGLFKQMTLLLGLWCWSWPIVSLCVAGSVATMEDRSDLLALDDANWFQRTIDALRSDARGLLLGGCIVFFAAFNNTTCFDLANISTIGNELRAQDALGAAPQRVLQLALPSLVLVSVGIAMVALGLRRLPTIAPHKSGASKSWMSFVSLIIWTASLLMPLIFLLSRAVSLRAVREFLQLYGQSLAVTLEMAVLSAVAAVLITLALAWALSDDRAWVRGSAIAQALLWLLLAVIPATVVAIAIEAAYNRDGLVSVYRSSVIVNLVHLARFSIVPVLMAWWIVAREPAPLRDLRHLDGARRLRAFLRSMQPRLIFAGVATGLIVFILSASEVAVSARVQPPGVDLLSSALLQSMHYQRPETIILGIVVLLLLAAVIALMVGALANVRLLRVRKVAPATLVIICAALVPGCSRTGGADEPLNVERSFGVNGTSLGQFAYPRCIDIDAARGFIYVIDKTARVQRFNFQGEPQLQWQMPEWELGKPTGVSVGPEGDVYVADTHYHRVMVFDAEGNERLRFGRYGEGDGEFIYPTDVAFGPKDTLYVSEYGGNDRIQIFSDKGEYITQFGAFGSPDDCDVCFVRPQSIAFNEDQTELFIADACSHRIVVIDPDGVLLRSFGRPGVAAGEMHYPYGFTLLEDETLLVVEFGNHRLQWLTRAGESLGLFGRLGLGEGELRYPWGVAAGAEEAFVLDSGNNRVQVMPVP